MCTSCRVLTPVYPKIYMVENDSNKHLKLVSLYELNNRNHSYIIKFIKLTPIDHYKPYSCNSYYPIMLCLIPAILLF